MRGNMTGSVFKICGPSADTPLFWSLLGAVKFSAGPEPRQEQQLLTAADAFCCRLLTRRSGILTLNNLGFIMYGEDEHSVFSSPCSDGIMILRKSQVEVVFFVFLN